MSQQVEGPLKTYTTTGTFARFARVKWSAAGVVAVAGAGEAFLGYAQEASLVSGQQIAVRLRNSPGTFKVIAAGSYAVGATVYGAAAGKVSTTSSGTAIGILEEASTGDGTIVELAMQA